MSKRAGRSAHAELAERRANVVNFAQQKAQRGWRLIRIQDEGKPSLLLVFPADNEAGEGMASLSGLLKFPYLCEPFAEALLGVSKDHGSVGTTTHSHCENLQRGFMTFLQAHRLFDLDPSRLTTGLVNSFVAWLNRVNDNKTAVLAVGTRAAYMSAFRMVIAWLQQDKKWRDRFPDSLQVPENLWAGAGRMSETTPTIPEEDLRVIYRKCKELVETTMTTVRDMRREMEAAASHPVVLVPEPTERTIMPGVRRPGQRGGQGANPYKDLGICLATLARRYPNQPLPQREQMLDRTLAMACDHFGFRSLSLCFYPSAQALVPFILLLGFHLDYNLQTVLSSKVDDFSIEQNELGRLEFHARLTTEAGDSDSQEEDPDAVQFRAEARKTRAKGKPQVQIRPVTADPDNPATIWRFIIEWTAPARSVVSSHFADRLFLFLSEKSAAKEAHVRGFQGKLSPSDDGLWHKSLDAFYKKHELPRHTFRRYRTTGLDITDVLFGGDIRAKQAAGNHAQPDTTYRSYTTSAQMARGDEALGQVLAVRTRWRESGGIIDPRRKPDGADLGAATPGWICVDPYSGPFGQPEKLCSAYGRCPDCPNTSIDPANSYSCAQAWNLLEAIDNASEAIAPQAWLERWGPVKEKLLQYWLPLFPDEVTQAAKKINLHPLPPLE
jgi:hypothetical protein